MGVINAVFPIVLMLIMGFLVKLYWIKTDEFWHYLDKIIYYILFPSLMIYSISISAIEKAHALTFIPILIGIIILLMFIIWLFRKQFKNMPFFISFIQGAVRYNSYVFIGVTVFYMGRQTMPIIALITAYLVITTNVISVILLNAYANERNSIFVVVQSTIKNPLIISCIMGLLINYMGIKFPIFIDNFIRELGDASLPLSLISVGTALHFNMNFRKIIAILNCALIKLIVLPAIVLVVLLFLHLPKIVVEVCLIYAGSPCTTNAYVMSKNMGGDYKSMGLIISTQTVLSMLTIPIWLLVYQAVI